LQSCQTKEPFFLAGVIENNRWENPLTPLSGRTGLEVTPISSYYEGPFVISNVSIRGNIFTGLAPTQVQDSDISFSQL
jgi:hypothetical protein